MKKLLTLLVGFVAIACGSHAIVEPGRPLGADQLKFAVIDAIGTPVYCDPDYYPIVRLGGEQTNADAYYPQIQANAELYAAIAAHEHLPSGNLDEAQKLTLYRAFKLLRALVLTQQGTSYSFEIRVQSRSGSASYELVDGTVRVDGVVMVTSRKPTGPPNCPICLAATTVIATPLGQVRVTDVRLGMLVWTEAAGGARIAAPVLKIGSIVVPPGHLMVHLRLADGRELLASPGHRTADGRMLGSLAVGDVVDGSTITLWELVPYSGDRTYDLLPAGATGTYWANGVLLASTLAP